MLSIVICTHNRAESLRHALQGVAEQAVPAGESLEVIVVDNASSDHTRAVVHEAAGDRRLPIRYVLERTLGLSHARNRGIREAQGALILFTDDDVLPSPRWVEQLSGAMKRFNADAGGGAILPLWLSPPPAWLEAPALRSCLWGVIGLLCRQETGLVDADDPAPFFGGNMAFRRSVLMEMGGFRTDLGLRGRVRIGGEDAEIARRFVRAGRPVVYAADAVVHHKVGPQRMRLQYFRTWRFGWGRTAQRALAAPPQRFPWWLLREAAGHAAAWAGARWRGDWAAAITHDLQVWTQLGQWVGALEAIGRRGCPPAPSLANEPSTSWPC